MEVAGPEDSQPGDGDNWFWQITAESDGIIDELLPIFAPHLVKPEPPKETGDATS